MSSLESSPDYELREVLELCSDEQFRALDHPLRHRILTLLNDRAATMAELANALGCLKGTVSHHLKVLEGSGLVRVVRERTVRGGTERFYGRTARRLELGSERPGLLLRLAAAQMIAVDADAPDVINLRHLRLTGQQVARLAQQLGDLADDAQANEAGGSEPTYAVLFGVYQTDMPRLSSDDS